MNPMPPPSRSAGPLSAHLCQLLLRGPTDFADCLHVALATQAGEQLLWAFDKGAARITGAQLLAKA
jgi:predicted nucleic acid-binding protein